MRGRGRGRGRGTDDSSIDKRNQVSGWNIQYERGMVFKKLEFTDKYVKAIQKLGWKTFVAPPCLPVPEVVREFYCNMNPRERASEVQGITVSYASDEINDLYKLPKVPADQNMFEGSHDWEEVRHT